MSQKKKKKKKYIGKTFLSKTFIDNLSISCFIGILIREIFSHFHGLFSKLLAKRQKILDYTLKMKI